ncbi:hypothetical protein TSUD_351500 [Trifolium subterraneum]|uniref:AB hydrolase-1 domain-containing protein n=1 Tax=Trifolium subterraneum TaxID=3900 RepID=A0A2Z6NZ87_TRISU|nr:hypothetical protein TSUD_351500 [Trifolium subterraneum]
MCRGSCAEGESDEPEDTVAGTLQTHARDVADFIHQNIRSPPVLLGHSFGGLIIQYYISNLGNNQLKENLSLELRGVVLVCSVPPSGNSGLVWRYLILKPIAAFKHRLGLLLHCTDLDFAELYLGNVIHHPSL